MLSIFIFFVLLFGKTVQHDFSTLTFEISSTPAETSNFNEQSTVPPAVLNKPILEALATMYSPKTWQKFGGFINNSLPESEFVTFFAPTEEVLETFGIERFENHPFWLENIFRNHFVGNAVVPKDPEKMERNLSNSVAKPRDENVYLINGFIKPVNLTNIKANNGIIHFVDSLLSWHDLTTKMHLYSNAEISTFKNYFEKCPELLNSLKNVSIFAPSNVFMKFSTKIHNRLLKNKKWIEKMLKMHIVEGELDSKQMMTVADAKTLNGQSVKFDGELTAEFVEIVEEKIKSKILTSDIVTKNGVIHIIDHPFGFPTGNVYQIVNKEANRFAVFFHADNFWNELLLSEDKEFTIFAPSDDVMKNFEDLFTVFKTKNPKIIDQILKLHVLMFEMTTSDQENGEVKTLNPRKNLTLDFNNVTNFITSPLDDTRASIIRENIMGTNGYVHIIDQVLGVRFESIMETLAKMYSPEIWNKFGSAFKNCMGKSDFITFFAPSESVLKRNEEKFDRDPSWFENVLKIHVVSDAVTAEEMVVGKSFKSITGSDLYFEKEGEKMYLTNKMVKLQITTTDIFTKTGIIHFVDSLFSTQDHSTSEYLSTNKDLSIFKQYFEKCPKVEDVTIFAPDNGAFSNVSSIVHTRLLKHEKWVEKMVKMHIVGGEYDVKKMKRETNAQTIIETLIKFVVDGTVVKVIQDDVTSKIIYEDIFTRDSVIQVIDHAFGFPNKNLYQMLNDNHETQRFANALNDALKNFLSSESTETTIFVPTDSAWQTALEGYNNQELSFIQNPIVITVVLKRHMFKNIVFVNDQQRINSTDGHDPVLILIDRFAGKGYSHYNVKRGDIEATINKPDLLATNGIVHLIDKVFGLPTKTMKQQLKAESQLTNLNQFSCLIDTVLEANNGFTTFFAPSNLAFKKLDPRHKNEILIRKVLKLHIVDGLVSTDAMNGKVATLDRGKELDFKNNGDKYSVTDETTTANIQKQDILAFNGIIHVIDTFLGMPTLTIWQILEEDPDFTTTFKLLNGTTIESIFKDSEEDSDRFSTVFLPTNDAWKNVSPSLTAIMANSPEMVENVFKRHIFPNILDLETVDEKIFRMMNDDKVHLRKINGSQNFELFVPKLEQTARILEKKGMFAINGFVHKIDQVFVSDKDVPTSMIGITNVGLPGSSAEVSTKMIPFIILGAFLI